jgi:ComF family protein
MVQVQRLTRGFLDLVFAPRCARCRRVLSAAGPALLCAACSKEAPAPATPLCPGCGRSPVEGPTVFCRSCRGGYHRDGLLAPADFEGLPRDLVYALKYRADFRAGKHLARLMAAMIGEELADDEALLVPVPLHRRRLRARGFNQASFLARCIARERGLPLAPAALVRAVDTLPLTGLDRRERKREVRGAIRVSARFRARGKRLLIIDDVFTTGATVEECCRVLKSAGALQTVAVAAARA